MGRTRVREAQPVQLLLSLRNHKRFRTRTLLLAFLLFVLCSTTSLALAYGIGTTLYQRDQHLAQDGLQHLLQGKARLFTLTHHPPDLTTVSEAQQEFVSAVEIFTRIEHDLQFVPDVMGNLPRYGDRLHTALYLVPLALALSRAGVASCDMLNVLIARLHDPFDGQSHGLMATDMPMLIQNIQTIQTSLANAANEIDQLHVSQQHDPHVQHLLSLASNELPQLQAWLNGLADIAPGLLGLLGIAAPAHYLIEILDSTELRPGGGFIGNYGTMTLSGGQLVSAHITDTDLIDHPFSASGRGIPFPRAYRWFDIAHGNWGLRDSNLDADFPTNARRAESMYAREGGDVPLQGVIALTPAFIQHALSITGPITLPEYHETVNAQNLIERIHYHQLGLAGEGSDDIASPDGHSSLRKRFVALLAEHFLARVHQIAVSHAFQFVSLLVNALHTKDIQICFDDPNTEMLLRHNHLDAAIQTPPGDDLLVVDANIGANKANNAITSTLTDTITIDRAGNATHHATLRYSWMASDHNYGLPLYRDYVRIYAPRGSTLQAQRGWQQRGHSVSFGHEVWAGFFTLTRGQTHTITLSWQVPYASTHDDRGWHYQEMIQRQAGVVWITHVQIVPPACGTARKTELSNTRNRIFTNILLQNTSPGARYSCP